MVCQLSGSERKQSLARYVQQRLSQKERHCETLSRSGPRRVRGEQTLAQCSPWKGTFSDDLTTRSLSSRFEASDPVTAVYHTYKAQSQPLVGLPPTGRTPGACRQVISSQ